MILEKFPGINCALGSVVRAEKQCETTREVRLAMLDIIGEVCKLELRELLFNLLQQRTKEFEFYAYQAETVNEKTVFRRLKLCLTPGEKTYMEEYISLNLNQIIDYACTTVSQSSCRLWHNLRRTRISSSIAHRIVTRETNFDKLALQLFNSKFTGNEATKYGNKMENAARSSFQFKNNVKVVVCGVVINEVHPWLCCSPDGLILSPESALLEIKCPHLRQGKKIVDHEKKESFVSYLYYENNEWQLKRRHQYYSQIQVSLFTLKLKSCILYVYSSVDHLQIKISIDKPFLAEYIPKLEMFYYNFYLKLVMNKNA